MILSSPPWRRLLFVLIALTMTPVYIQASISCENNNHTICEERLRKGSFCLNGECTNPFASGCLHAVLGEEQAAKYTAQTFRACNSDDSTSGSTSGRSDGGVRCSSAEDNFLDYPEIRISNGNWESSMFIAWIFQILLSELLGVPATIETSNDGGDGSFYNLQNEFVYASRTYNWDGLKIPLEMPNGDCSSPEARAEYCCHVVPEVWPSQRSVIAEKVDDSTIVPVSSLDVVGKLGIYIPTFTAQRDLSLTSVLGLSDGNNLNTNVTVTTNRHKVAQAFKLPTTWKYYCDNISPNNCTEGDDDVAQRYPNPDDGEDNKYWVDNGVYKGYFRATEHNNCTKYPHNCTGHFIDGRCDWSTLAQAQTYWNRIPVTSALGPDQPYGSYGYWSMIEIWHAANETRSDVMMWWWSTDWMLQSFIGTAGEFVKIDLPAPTLDCINNRVSEQGKCSNSPTQQRGLVEGSCDYEPAVLLKAVSSALQTTQLNVPEAEKSAALGLIQDFRTSDLVLDYLLKEWYLKNNDRFGYDPRDVVCQWVADNIDDLQRIVPKGYPRKILPETNKYSTAVFRAARGLAVAVGAASVLSLLLVAAWRKRRVIRYAQPDFLYLVLVGFLLLSAASLLFTLEPQSTTCILRPWFGLLGSSFELLPLIVKVQAILKAVTEASNFRRVKIQRIHLLGAVLVFIAVITAFLVAWTVVDPPTRQEELVLLTDDESLVNDVGGLYVQVQIDCASDSNWWEIIGLLWQLLLLFWATILAYQTRNFRTEFNESQFLGFMIYTHFLFVMLRFILVVIVANNFTPADRQVAVSYLLTMDTFVTLNIYFAPKFYKAIYDQRGAEINSADTTRWTSNPNMHASAVSAMSTRQTSSLRPPGSSGGLVSENSLMGASGRVSSHSLSGRMKNSDVESNKSSQVEANPTGGSDDGKLMEESAKSLIEKMEEAKKQLEESAKDNRRGYDSDDDGGEEARPCLAANSNDENAADATAAGAREEQPAVRSSKRVSFKADEKP